jgi:hypothetical protein
MLEEERAGEDSSTSPFMAKGATSEQLQHDVAAEANAPH